MRREYTVEEFLTVVEAYRDAFPRGTLSTDLIIGFPRETETDHRKSMKLLERVRPDIVNVTRFSPRAGTPAYAMPNRVVGWRVKERSREVTRLKDTIGLEKNRRWIGRSVSAVTTERGKPGTTLARTPEYRPLVLGEVLPLGTKVDAVVSGATAAILLGSDPKVPTCAGDASPILGFCI
jgi:tRNA A37 methylthiotransferase MiaB